MEAPQLALIVDPQPADLSAAAGILQALGCATRVVTTYEEARAYLAATTALAALVTAVRLREFNGVHLALRARARFPRAGIAVADRSFDRVIELAARQAGACYLVKPIDASALEGWARSSVTLRSHADTRRWIRKPLTARPTALAGDRFARLIDVSRGGLRLEVPRDLGEHLPASIHLAIPVRRLEILVRPVWARVAPGASAGECGAELLPVDLRAAGRWREYVDGL